MIWYPYQQMKNMNCQLNMTVRMVPVLQWLCLQYLHIQCLMILQDLRRLQSECGTFQ